MSCSISNVRTLSTAGVFLLSLISCLSCQNLNKGKSGQPEQASLSPVIDKTYFETQADTAYLKGERAFLKADKEKALRHFKQALSLAPQSPHLIEKIASIYEEEGLMAEASIYYKKLTKNGEETKKFNERLIDIYASRDFSRQALKYQKELLDQEPENPSLHLKQALLLIHEGKWKKALKSLETAESKDPGGKERAQILLSKAYLFASQKKVSQSLKIMEKLEKQTIQEANLVLKITDFYKALGQDQMALSYLEDFQSRSISQPVSLTLLNHYIADQDWDKAEEQMQYLQNRGWLENQHYFYMALLAMEKQNYDQSLRFLKDLRAKNPENGQYLYLLAMAYEKKEEPSRALKIYNQIPANSSHFLAGQLQSVQVLKSLGRERQSFSLLKKLSFPKKGEITPYALLLYAESLWESGHKKKSIRALTKGLKKRPDQADLLLLRGFYFKQSGDWKLALKDMHQILEKQKNHEEALNFIAASYAERKIHLDTAEKMARKALSLNPKSSYFLSTLGWILFQKGKPKSALNYLNEAFSKNNKDNHIAQRLGQVHLQLKNFEKSDFFFKEARKLEKEAEQAKSKGNVVSFQKISAL